MIKEELKIFFTSLMFYTRIPCPSYIDHSEEYLNKATRYFPLIGIIVGSISFISFWLSNQLFNVEISVIISIATGIFVTGAFHEDGLADTFDGFGGGWSKEKILEIMKDSRIGTYGTISLVVLLILKTFSFSSLILLIESNLNQSSDLIIFLIFITYHSISNYSRDDSLSKSKPVAKSNSVTEILLAYLWGLAPLIGLIYFIPQYLSIVLPLGLLFFSSSRYFQKRIDGYTGDCLGAVEQLSEVMCLLIFLVLANMFI